jgi:hypothetical protein
MPTHTLPFRPTTHGFPFPNWYPPGSPVVEVPTPFGRLKFGDANGGLCGGMVFAALDLYLFGVPRPLEPTPPVYKYFCKRLLESWNLPFGVLKYYDWQRRAGASKVVAGVPLVAGVTRLTAAEWPRIKAAIDSGVPAALGLVNACSFSPRQLCRNHQVLAYGYDWNEATGDLAVKVYDPNYPNDDTMDLRVNLADPDREELVTHGCEGKTVRGFFLTEYRRPVDPPVFA